VPDGGAPTCVPLGGECTTDSDCCEENCIPVGNDYVCAEPLF
jgi:hypothetical protein